MKDKVKVYVVCEDNGEEYSDYEYWVSKVFSTKRKAQNWINKEISRNAINYCKKLWILEMEVE